KQAGRARPLRNSNITTLSVLLSLRNRSSRRGLACRARLVAGSQTLQAGRACPATTGHQYH
ncbi:hypothetical protein ACQKFN_18330, partial [Serratia sp. NPDC071084]|uniref:hypothetical protein n=1 Tax=Serratia sp. NPDC071084 TaxID=3390676 RepID=UPI003D00778A